MNRLRRWFKENKSDFAFYMIIALVIKLVGDTTRTYEAFGGEDLLLLGTTIYWLYRMATDKLEHTN